MVEQTQYSMEFVEEVLWLFDDFGIGDLLSWRCGKKYGGGWFCYPASFFIDCNDMFWWGTADCEELTPGNINILRQSVEDCKKIEPVCGAIDGCYLFCCRVKQLRPQHCCYPKEPLLWSLFDAAGPPREVDFGNPYPHPRDKQNAKGS